MPTPENHQRLMSAFAFSEEDVHSNRNGVITPHQYEQLLMTRRVVVIIVPVLIALTVVIDFIWTRGQLRLFPFVLFAAVLGGVLLYYLRRYPADTNRYTLQHVSGELDSIRYKFFKKWREAEIGGQKFYVNAVQYHALAPYIGQHITIYYTQPAHHIIAVDVVDVEGQ